MLRGEPSKILPQVRARIFAAHLGAEVQVNAANVGEEFVAIADYSISSWGNFSAIARTSTSKWSTHGAISDECKLILKPFTSMTDEDAEGVAKIVLRRHNRHYRSKDELSYRVSLRNNAAVEVTLMHQSQQIPKPPHLDLLKIRIEQTSIVTMGADTDVMRQNEVYHTSDQYEALDFLRSHGYDCGYGDIPSLIDAGIAISAPNDERSVATVAESEKKS